MRFALFRAVAFLATTSIAISAAVARNPPPPKRFGVVYRPDGIEFRPSCKGARPFEHCEVLTKSVPPKPQLLKRHGIVYGVRGIADVRDCQGFPPSDGCYVYSVSGTIGSVYADEHGINGFDLRMAGGRTKRQNIMTRLPAAAEKQLRSGRRVRVSGTIAGQGQVATLDEVILARRR